MRRSSSIGAGIACAVLVSGSCSSPSEPTHRAATPVKLEINVVADQQIATGDTALFIVHVPGDESYTVRLSAVSGEATAVERDSTSAAMLASVHAAASGAVVGTTDTTMYNPADRVVSIAVTGDGHFRLSAEIPYGSAEHINPAFAIGDTVVGESIDGPQDLDYFSFKGRAGDELVAYSQKTDSVGGVSMQLVRSVADTVQMTRGAADLDESTERPFTLSADRRYTVIVRGTTGPYRFAIRRLVRAPEHVPPALTLGDTLDTEAIDYVGDIDEYTFAGTAGRRYWMLFRSGTGRSSDLAAIDVRSPDGAMLAGFVSRGTDPALLEEPPFAFIMPPGGSVNVSVHSDTSFGEFNRVRGQYQVFPYLVDSLPESASHAATLGDTVDETLAVPNDVDDYQLTVPRDTDLALTVSFGGGERQAAFASIYAVGDTEPLLTNLGELAPDHRYHSLSAHLAAGTYTLRMSTTRYVGPYSVETHGIDTRPESTTAVLTLGDTVTDAITPGGDRDTWTFSGTAGVPINISTVVPSGTVEATITDLSTNTQIFGSGFNNPDWRQFRRVVLPSTGTYRLSFAEWDQGVGVATAPLYRFVVRAHSTAPETHAAVIALEDTVADERIDYPEDIDLFRVNGTPGTEVRGRIQASDSTCDIVLEEIDPATSAVLQSLPSCSAATYLPAVTIPAGGSLLLRVYMPDGFMSTGPYDLRMLVVNRAPEHVAAGIAVGDSVAGESLDRETDIDEFTFSGTAGQQVTLSTQFPLGPSGPSGLDVIDITSGTTVAHVGILDFDVHTTGPVTLPTTGSYLIRMSSSDGWGTGAYWFTLHAAP